MNSTERVTFETEIEFGGVALTYTLSYRPECANFPSPRADIHVMFGGTDADHMFYGVPDRERILELACDAHHNIFHNNTEGNTDDASHQLHS